MILRIKNVDMDGYLGRDNHPEKTDEGHLVSVIGLDTYVFDNEGRSICPVIEEKSWRAGKADPRALMAAQDEILDNEGSYSFERCWLCLTDDGRTLELMDHEVELVRS